MKKLFSLLAICFSGYLCSVETTFLLIRHGETDWNAQGKTQGHTNIPLNEKGIAQSQELAHKLHASHPDITKFYSSDLDRAYDTALASAEKFDLKVEKRPSFRELSYGEAEGMYFADRFAKWGAKEKALNEKYPDRKHRWSHTAIPGAETYNQLLQRFKDELLVLAKTHPGEKIAVFAHGRAIRTIIENIIDREYTAVSNCGVAKIVHSSENQENPFTFHEMESSVTNSH